MLMRVALVHVVNFYLDENKAGQVKPLASKGKVGEQDRKALRGFVLEALRKSFRILRPECALRHSLCVGLDPPFTGVYRTCTEPGM
jgi:hypothetical protein